jgi:hypothetical protein
MRASVIFSFHPKRDIFVPGWHMGHSMSEDRSKFPKQINTIMNYIHEDSDVLQPYVTSHLPSVGHDGDIFYVGVYELARVEKRTFKVTNEIEVLKTG